MRRVARPVAGPTAPVGRPVRAARPIAPGSASATTRPGTARRGRGTPSRQRPDHEASERPAHQPDDRRPDDRRPDDRPPAGPRPRQGPPPYGAPRGPRPPAYGARGPAGRPPRPGCAAGPLGRDASVGPPRGPGPDAVRHDPTLELAEGEELVAGRRPVQEAFVARRTARRLLVVPQRRHALEQLVLHATSLRIPVVEVEGGTLTAVAGFDGHQGIALVVDTRRWSTPAEILARAAEREAPPLVLVLDSLEDPQNLGTLLRTAEASGVHGAVFPTRAPGAPVAGRREGVRGRRGAPAAGAGRRPAGRARGPPRRVACGSSARTATRR